MARKTKTKVEEPIMEEVAPEVTETNDVVEEVEATPVYLGVVAKCSRLNIRKKAEATSEVVCIVNAGTELVIDKTYKNQNWLKVVTKDNKEGFCMKEFVTVK